MNAPFNGWAQGVWYYGPVMAVGAVLAFALFRFGYHGAAGLGVLVFLTGLAMMLFFRDFPRTIAATGDELACPADGTVVAIEDLAESPHYTGKCRRVSIFMSIFSAHVNRAPFDATVSAVKYAPGAYRDARDPESSQVNESNALWLDTAKGAITVRQISGAVARHIVCAAQPGMRLARGEKYGMIRFGSRVEIYLPPSAEIYVTLNQKVYAGITVVGQLQ